MNTRCWNEAACRACRQNVLGETDGRHRNEVHNFTKTSGPQEFGISETPKPNRPKVGVPERFDQREERAKGNGARTNGTPLGNLKPILSPDVGLRPTPFASTPSTNRRRRNAPTCDGRRVNARIPSANGPANTPFLAPTP